MPAPNSDPLFHEKERAGYYADLISVADQVSKLETVEPGTVGELIRKASDSYDLADMLASLSLRDAFVVHINSSPPFKPEPQPISQTQRPRLRIIESKAVEDAEINSRRDSLSRVTNRLVGRVFGAYWRLR
jgi:hypothetical protein